MFLIAVVAVVQGMNRYMTEKFAGTVLGVNTFRLRQYPDVQLGNVTDSTWRSWVRRPRIKLGDGEAVARALTVATTTGWESSTRVRIAAGRRAAQDVLITGATDRYFDIKDLTIEHGRAVTAEEETAGGPVVVLGYEPAGQTFRGRRPIGRAGRVPGPPLR